MSKRIQINEKSFSLVVTLVAASWNSSKKTNSVIVSLNNKILSGQYYNIEIEPILNNLTVEGAYTLSSQITKANISYSLNGYTSTVDFVCNGEIPSVDIPIIIHFIPKEYMIDTEFAYVNDMGYLSAADGMTWGEWVDSIHNSYGYSWQSDGLLLSIRDGLVISNIKPADFIISGRLYDSYIIECCFVAGTQVLMADNTTINIENVKIGDQVISYDIDTGENYIVSVLNTIVNKHSIKMAKVIFDNGVVLEMTDYHPIYTLNGWKSLTNHMGYETLVVGDIAKTINGWSGIVEIEQYILETPIETYTLDVIGLDENPDRDDNTHDNFYANGIVVHNAACPI